MIDKIRRELYAAIKDALIQVAIDDKFPLDLNDLDLSVCDKKVKAILGKYFPNETLLNKAKVAEEVLGYFTNIIVDYQEEQEEGFAGITEITVLANGKIEVSFDDCDGSQKTLSLTPKEWENL